MTKPAADDVDRIVAAWRRERPDLDVAPLQVLSRVSRLARRLDLARGAAFAEHGLEGWEFDVLSALRRAGDALPALPRPARAPDAGHQRHDDQPGRPARAPRLVERSPTPHDRRGVIVRLTPTGHGRRRRRPGRPAGPTSASCSPSCRAHDRDELAALLRRLLAPFET